MPMYISPSIDTSTDHTATMFPQMSPIAKSLPPATQSDILRILQREQDRAMTLLSSSPLLASLFISYANQAAAFESSTPPTESEEWKALENTVSRLQEEIDKLRPENIEMRERLAAAGASLEAFRSQVASLKEVNVAQQLDIKSLQTELLEFKDKYDRLAENSTAERDALQSAVSDFMMQQAELKETIVLQQLKLSKVGPESIFQTRTECPQPSKQEEDQEAARRLAEYDKRMERKRREMAERKAQKAEDEAREKAKRDMERAERIQLAEREANFTDSEQGLSPPKPAHPTLAPEVMPEALSNSTSESPKMPQGVKEEIPGTPKPRPNPSLTSPPVPANTEPEKPLPSLQRNKPKATPQPGLAPTQRSSGWGSWGSSFLNPVVSIPDRTPSPEPPLVRPTAWGGTGGSGDNTWGSSKNVPTPIAQKTSAVPAWGTKPVSGFGPGVSTRGSTTGPSFGSGIPKNLTVDTMKKLLESSPNTVGLEDIPESAVDIKHVPRPGTFHTVETATPAEEDDFEWAIPGGKKKGHVVGQTPSVPNAPDLDNVDEGVWGGGGEKKKKGKRSMMPTTKNDHDSVAQTPSV